MYEKSFIDNPEYHIFVRYIDDILFGKKILNLTLGRSSLVVNVSDRGWLVTSSSPVPLKNRCVGERCTLNLSTAETSSRWCGVVVRKGGASSSVVLIT
ncbi:hypothetical protein TNCV_3215041 [Trichonephila clavipes]|nr:hypothetical protein TNCV_3215041 [Trichonephila clavipes]